MRCRTPTSVPPSEATIMLDFGGLEYMNSSGIGLLVTLLVRAKRNRQRMLRVRLDSTTTARSSR